MTVEVRTAIDGALFDDADTIIVQHLPLGLNAHLSLDLAIAAARTSPGEAIHALRRGFLLINDIPARIVLGVADASDVVGVATDGVDHAQVVIGVKGVAEG
ncbi:DUF5995 family protein [Streptomyces sp. NPDC097610]|uniref:DUF5995 family protein n=1 Tax=Streptomyces sp. NPDC097610 TaxID=3157227 RepID=UPI0033219DE6